LIEPEEERRQWVFHVMVSDRYVEWRQAQTEPSESDVQSVAGTKETEEPIVPLLENIGLPQP
jgi:hypothetical protein